LFWVLDSFLSFLRTYKEKKSHIVHAFMLDPKLKSIHLVFSYVGEK
jgi:hypothetical protein